MHNVLPSRWRRDTASPELLEALPSDGVVHTNGTARFVPLTAAPAAINESSVPHHDTSLVRVDAVEMRSLMSIAMRCAVVTVVVGCLGATMLWMVATATGVVTRTESFMQSIGFRDVRLSAPQVIMGTAMVVGGIAFALATAAVMIGASYNAFALNSRGLQLRVHAVAATENDEHTPTTELLERRRSAWPSPDRTPTS